MAEQLACGLKIRLRGYKSCPRRQLAGTTLVVVGPAKVDGDECEVEVASLPLRLNEVAGWLGTALYRPLTSIATDAEPVSFTVSWRTRSGLRRRPPG